MIKISFITLELVFTAIWLFCRAAVWLRQKKIDWKRETLLLLMYVNLAVIIRFTFFPMALADGWVQPLLFDAAAILPFKTNLIPFHHLFVFDTLKELLLNIIGNVAMFIPSGIILPILYKKLGRFWRTVAVGAGISLCIEILQLLFFERTTDINDLILNTLGAAIGYGLYALVRSLRSQKT